MKQTTFLAIAASAVLATPVFAQNAKADAKSDSTMRALVGLWEGGVYSDHAPESTLKMTFSKGAAFKVVVSIVSNGQDFVTGEASDLKIDGNSVTWTQGLMQQSCSASGVLIAGALKGEFTCGEHGGVTFLAKKK
ncbi:MAG: hypothetical protein ABI852_07280 [Gemmatimonadaceae bacterium]